ncbi:hypothetical protein GCM10012280_65310 [Wenjunlia tyrosinilytica]|uniref:Uncharacterized protein n=1 Tax=Wenjunlia tyrosinilytica TaxID=1544741 RepID=A0A917ZWL1_9ACTN|nr:hypothetical protein GCM10012280_65310 [Wenjunlia tyrosinilytica]
MDEEVIRPATAAELQYEEDDVNADLDLNGVPPRPDGRLWLLRPFGGFATVEDIKTHLLHLYEARRIDDQYHPEQARRIKAQLAADELSRLPGQT